MDLPSDGSYIFSDAGIHGPSAAINYLIFCKHGR